MADHGCVGTGRRSAIECERGLLITRLTRLAHDSGETLLRWGCREKRNGARLLAHSRDQHGAKRHHRRRGRPPKIKIANCYQYDCLNGASWLCYLCGRSHGGGPEVWRVVGGYCARLKRRLHVAQQPCPRRRSRQGLRLRTIEFMTFA